MGDISDFYDSCSQHEWEDYSYSENDQEVDNDDYERTYFDQDG